MEHKKKFRAGEKQVCVYPCPMPDAPVLYLNTFAREGSQVRRALQEQGCYRFTLVTVENLQWEHDMAPWDIPPISEGDTPCTGGADAYLQLMTEVILPQAEKNLEAPPAWRGLAGYSLAGLFALYALYRTGLF